MKGIQLIPSLILALSFLMVGLINLFFGNIPVTGSFITVAIIFVSLSIYLISTHRRLNEKAT